MKKNTIFLSFLILFFSCKNEVKTPPISDKVEKTAPTNREKTMAEIMVAHDEVMPLTNDIETLQKDLKTKLATEKNTAAKTAILAKLTGLEKADKAMYAWMDGFKSDFTGMSEVDIDTYLLSEKTKVEAMAKIVKEAVLKCK